MRITRRQLRKIIREAFWADLPTPRLSEDDEIETTESPSKIRKDLLEREYEHVDGSVSYPFGRNRGDIRKTDIYQRKDGKPIPEEDLLVFKALETDERKHSMAALMGIHTHTVDSDGVTLRVKYYRHTAG
tara:strand:- start:151 stop:540 length:390 start_codon:yes stop_codon:yes gene_type:complete